MAEYSNNTESRNTLLTIILVLLILITGAMIFNFYGMRFQGEPTNVPKCVGSDDLMLEVSGASGSQDSDSSKDSARKVRVQKMLEEKVGDYSDGSYHPEMQREMIRRAQEDARNRIRQKAEAQIKELETSKKASETKKVIEKMESNGDAQVAQAQTRNSPKTDKPESGKTKLCIYHMNGCGHCHDIMTIKQSNGMTKFEELRQVFADKPEVDVLDFQHGRDPEASKFNAFPVIMLVKDTGNIEYNRERSVEGMARFIVQNM